MCALGNSCAPSPGRAPPWRARASARGGMAQTAVAAGALGRTAAVGRAPPLLFRAARRPPRRLLALSTPRRRRAGPPLGSSPLSLRAACDVASGPGPLLMQASTPPEAGPGAGAWLLVPPVPYAPRPPRPIASPATASVDAMVRGHRAALGERRRCLAREESPRLGQGAPRRVEVRHHPRGQEGAPTSLLPQVPGVVAHAPEPRLVAAHSAVVVRGVRMARALALLVGAPPRIRGHALTWSDTRRRETRVLGIVAFRIFGCSQTKNPSPVCLASQMLPFLADAFGCSCKLRTSRSPCCRGGFHRPWRRGGDKGWSGVSEIMQHEACQQYGATPTRCVRLTFGGSRIEGNSNIAMHEISSAPNHFN